MGKRPAAATAVVSAAKKAAKPKPSPEEIKCQQVVNALRQADLPEEVSTMLGDIIPYSLALCVEDRHPFQQAMVDVMMKELEKQEAGLQTTIEEAEASVTQNEKDKEADEVKVEALQKQTDEKKTVAQEKKHILADAALAFRAGKEGVAEAEAKQKEGNKDLDEVASRQAGLDAAISEILEPLKDGSMAPEMVKDMADQLVPKLQQYFEVEDSLVQAAPKALAKEPAARGPFDTMVANQLSESAKKALAAFAATVKGGEASRAERAAVVAAAAETLAAARDSQRAAAAAFKAAEAEELAVEAELREAQKTLRSRGPQGKARAKAVTKSQDALAAFREGPLATFKELSTKSSVQPAEPAEPAEPADAEMGAAEGEKAAVAEEEMATA